MTKQNFSKKDLHRLEKKHIEELLDVAMFSTYDNVDMNILSSVEDLLYELGFNEYLHHFSRLRRLADYDYTEENYYDENFPYDDEFVKEVCSVCFSTDCNGECMGD